MTPCPVCREEQHADQAAFNHHVNSHFTDDQVGPSRLGGIAFRESYPANDTYGNVTQSPMQGDAFCPLCDFPLSFATPVERNNHVNSCMDIQSGAASSMGARQPSRSQSRDGVSSRPQDPDFAFDENTPRTNGQSAQDNWVEAGWDGPAKPGAWSDWVSRKVDKGDRWWDPVHGGKGDAEIPPNFSPGVIPVLAKILQRSSAKGISRSAVLSRDAVHIKTSFPFDITWGCGYRNALMAIASLLQAKAAYRQPFSETDNGSEPGVRRIQGWIEEALSQGYDRDGRDHFRGKLLGTKKWIGTADLYVMFSYKGIPCDLYDFVNDKRSAEKTAHLTLTKWVKAYFDDDRSRRRDGDSAYDVMMRTSEGGVGRGEMVRLSRQFPLVLQHSGHSRLIVGYEETTRGEINLLVLDPGKSMHKDIRAEGIASLSPRNKRTDSANSASSLSRHSTRKPSHESMTFSRPYTNGASEITQSYDPPQVASTFTIGRKSSFADGLRAKPHSLSAELVPRLNGGAEDIMEEDEEMDEKGWVRKKVKKVIHPNSLYDGEKWKVPDAIQPFRASASQLSNHSEYQILAFTGGPPLTVDERQARKVVTSTRVKNTPVQDATHARRPLT